MTSTDAIPALQARGLTRHYGRHVALSDCTLALPQGHVIALLGPNGAGKSTLLALAAGMILPTRGTISVLGRTPAADAAALAAVGFVAQDAPLYRSLTVADHLRLGAELNPGWDRTLAEERIAELGLRRSQRAGSLSGGQRALLALALAVAKRPSLLILDEPVASLDPLARRQFLQSLMGFVASSEATVILSSHLVAELERVCDYAVVLTASRLRIAGEVDELVATHYQLSGPVGDAPALAADVEVISATYAGRQASLTVRSTVPVDRPGWSTESLALEDIVLAYMASCGQPAAGGHDHADVAGSVAR
jgi:ABC-2 type transport system ATP-binding protein